MGLRCSCGVRSNPILVQNNEFFFDTIGSSISGTGTYTVDVCADRSLFNIFTFSFTPDDLNPINSFTFTLTSTTDVICQTQIEGCELELSGTGLITGETTPRSFTTRFFNVPDESPINDFVLGIEIEGFGRTTSGSPSLNDLIFLSYDTFYMKKRPSIGGHCKKVEIQIAFV